MADPFPLVPAGVVVPVPFAARVARVLARGLRALEVEDGVRDGDVAALLGQLERVARVARAQGNGDGLVEVSVEGPEAPAERLCGECGEPSSDCLRHGLCNRCRMRVRRAAERSRLSPLDEMRARMAALDEESERARLAAERSRLRYGLA